MKKRIFSSLLLVMMLFALTLGMVGCGKDEISGITLSVYNTDISYNAENKTSAINFSLSVTNQNGDSKVNRYTYVVYCYDYYGNTVASQTFTRDYGINPHVTTYIDNMTFTAYGAEVTSIRAVPVSMQLGAADGDSSSDGPVFTDVSTWGPGAWFWVIIAAIFALSAVGNIIGGIAEFVDWGDIDSEEGWGMLIGGIISGAITVIILVLLF